MIALRPAFGALAVLVLVAACGSSTPSTSSPPSAAPSDQPDAEPSGAAAGAATWWVAPDAIPLAPETTVIKGVLMEAACASGQSPDGRINEPAIDYGANFGHGHVHGDAARRRPGLPRQSGVPGRDHADRGARRAGDPRWWLDAAARRHDDPVTTRPNDFGPAATSERSRHPSGPLPSISCRRPAFRHRPCARTSEQGAGAILVGA